MMVHETELQLVCPSCPSSKLPYNNELVGVQILLLTVDAHINAALDSRNRLTEQAQR
jgi:hypothetical protein